MEAVAVHLATEGPVTGDGFRMLRLAVGMRAKEVAELLGTRPATISQWESGAVRVDLWAWSVLAGLVLEELGRPPLATRERLARYRGTRHPKTVSIEVAERQRFDATATRAGVIRAVEAYLAYEAKAERALRDVEREIGREKQEDARRRLLGRRAREHNERADVAIGQYVALRGRGQQALKVSLNALHPNFGRYWPRVVRELSRPRSEAAFGTRYTGCGTGHPIVEPTDRQMDLRRGPVPTAAGIAHVALVETDADDLLKAGNDEAIRAIILRRFRVAASER